MKRTVKAGNHHPVSILAIVALGLMSSIAVAQSADRTADALLAIDQQRTSVVERIVTAWGPTLAKSSDYVSIDDLRQRLMNLRADRLFAATLAGTEDGLREVTGLASAKPSFAPAVQTKALGDTGTDAVYTPVTPCRLVDTRGTFAAVYQGNGTASHTPVPFAANEIRTYTVQGGNGMCLTQLPAGLNPSAVQLQVFGMPTTNASGDIEILPQGATFGSTATMVYVASINFNTVSTAAKINTADKQISVQVRGGGAHLAIDVVGYFAAPSGNGGKFFMQGGNAFGATALLGTIDNQPLDLYVNNLRAVRYIPNAISPNIVAGQGNAVSIASPGQTIAGGGQNGNCQDPPSGSLRPCGNQTSNQFATIGGGFDNRATGPDATIAGGAGNTASDDSASIGGGESNTASGRYSAVPGGSFNSAIGFSATAAGGYGNTASGNYSFAAGLHATAKEEGMFVWGDASGWEFDPTQLRAAGQSAGTFNVRATGIGGVLFVTGINPSTGATTSVCYTQNLSGWTCTSDRNVKRNLRPVDSSGMLAKVVAMPVYHWQPKDGPNREVEHLGPMAQDFMAAFGLGDNDKAIGFQDAEGVAFAAIQGLHQLVQQERSKVEAQEREIRALKDRIARVESMHDEVAELRATMAAFARAAPSVAAGAILR